MSDCPNMRQAALLREQPVPEVLQVDPPFAAALDMINTMWDALAVISANLDVDSGDMVFGLDDGRNVVVNRHLAASATRDIMGYGQSLMESLEYQLRDETEQMEGLAAWAPGEMTIASLQRLVRDHVVTYGTSCQPTYITLSAECYRQVQREMDGMTRFNTVADARGVMELQIGTPAGPLPLIQCEGQHRSARLQFNEWPPPTLSPDIEELRRAIPNTNDATRMVTTPDLDGQEIRVARRNPQTAIAFQADIRDMVMHTTSYNEDRIPIEEMMWMPLRARVTYAFDTVANIVYYRVWV